MPGHGPRWRNYQDQDQTAESPWKRGNVRSRTTKVLMASKEEHCRIEPIRLISRQAKLTVRVKSPEWRWQRRRADLRHSEIFRHRPIIIYTRLPAGETYYPICMFPTNSERLIGISDALSAFVYGYLSSCPRAHCTPNKSVTTLRYTRRHGPVYTGLACRRLPSAVPWISEDRLFIIIPRM